MTDPKSPSKGDEQRGQEKWYETTRYQILLFAGGIALFGLVLGLILDWYIDPQTSAQKKDLVQALGLITAGVAGAVGIFFTWRGQRLARRAQEENQSSTQEQLSLSRKSQEQNQKTTQAQLQNAQEELRLTRQGQITERFTRAIDQLGNESLETRLGGIYALQRIARESEEDHWAIMEVLTAYVRQNAPWQPEKAQGSEADSAVEETPEEDLSGESETTVFSQLSPDRVIEPALWQQFGDRSIKLALWQRSSTPAPDIQAIMTILRRRTRNFGHGEPEPLDLHKTRLMGANLRRADLKGTELWRANLFQAALWEANLTGADLSGADLWGASLWRADLSGASLWEADLGLVDLVEANLSGADLRKAKYLTQAQLEKTSGDENTKLPPGLKPPAHWHA
jgi:pentapeptide repeat protein